MDTDAETVRPRALDALRPVPNRAGLEFRLLIGHADGVRDLFLGEAVLAPGAEVPPHRHVVPEAIVVLEGMLTVRVGDETAEVPAGHAFTFPADRWHAVRNRGATAARFLATAPWDHATYGEATTYLEAGSGPQPEHT